MTNFFKVLYKSKKSKARIGKIKTSHGLIKTPSFVPVATKGTVKAITPNQVKEIGMQAAFVNTYHLVTHPGVDIIERTGGIHKYSRLNIPLMSDSGGFQVFSLAKKQYQKSNIPLEARLAKGGKNQNDISKIKNNQTIKANVRAEESPLLVKISDDGVKLRSIYDGSLIEFTPEKSMEFQKKIGADINMAFDECTYYPASHDYAEKAMERTHEWLKRCIKYKMSVDSATYRQYLYGIIQGGTFEDLRKISAEFVVSQNTPGVAIGGVSVGESKKEMRDQVKWVSDYLSKDRPVHLLGVGQTDDIIDLVKYGIDTFDCVEPTRLARMGTVYQSEKEAIDINKNIYKNNLEPVDTNCNCYVCSNFTKSYLHHLFKQREILGYTLATHHNLWTMEKLFEKIREAISNDLI